MGIAHSLTPVDLTSPKDRQPPRSTQAFPDEPPSLLPNYLLSCLWLAFACWSPAGPAGNPPALLIPAPPRGSLQRHTRTVKGARYDLPPQALHRKGAMLPRSNSGTALVAVGKNEDVQIPHGSVAEHRGAAARLGTGEDGAGHGSAWPDGNRFHPSSDSWTT